MSEHAAHSYPEGEVKELCNLTSQGDEHAFTRLVDIHWNRVYSHALAYTKSTQRAQEITQDVFLKIWKKRLILAEVDDFKSFLFILSRNQVISAMRKKLRELSAEDPGEIMEEVMQPDMQVQFKEVYEIVLKGIEQLPPVRRKVFKMSRLDGLSYEEIAQTLNISRNTVKEHIVLGLNFLRTYVHTHSDQMLTLTVLGAIVLCSGEK
ncbi:MAG TPA: RNA polymerase sigma-70 factor [Chitinophaga sp.]|uniref:RNA polymerase sigma factor n=1 Tax=Chitinophaga sp. TaxID=1869181 RepID=UPI002B5FB39D|nr:RNA polymerase sigma-70 factor [Chitinophaga sp.]HVI46106.1 RNA polymerase sigma-70 factor [Chitinophaga sp.]